MLYKNGIIDMMKDKSGEDFYKTHQLTDNLISTRRIGEKGEKINECIYKNDERYIN